MHTFCLPEHIFSIKSCSWLDSESFFFSVFDFFTGESPSDSLIASPFFRFSPLLVDIVIFSPSSGLVYAGSGLLSNSDLLVLLLASVPNGTQGFKTSISWVLDILKHAVGALIL